MPLHELSSTSIILLGSNLGCLLLLFVLVIGLSRKVARLSSQLAALLPLPISPTSQPHPSATQPPSQQGSFDAFLAEDPSRARLTKNEQFAAYRDWRRSRGLNWSPTESPNTP